VRGAGRGAWDARFLAGHGEAPDTVAWVGAPADGGSGCPPGPAVRVVRIRHVDLAESTPRRALSQEVNPEAVEALQVEHDRAAGAVELERHVRPAPRRHVGAGETPEGAAGKLDGRFEGIFGWYASAPAGRRLRPVLGERGDGAGDGRRLAHQEAREVDEVTPQVEEGIRARRLRVLVPCERRVGVEERCIREARPKVMD